MQSPFRNDNSSPFSPRMGEAAALFRAGRYGESLEKYEAIRERAHQQGKNPDTVARATANVGACQFALHQYQAALGAFQEARRLALAAGDRGVAAVFEGNIASLYEQLGNLDAAAEWVKDSLGRLEGRDRSDQLAKLQIQMATLLTRQKKTGEAWWYFRQGIEGARRAGDFETYAIGWSRIGEEALQAADPDEGAPAVEGAERTKLLETARTAIEEAYRVRRERHLPLDTSYRLLGRLRLAEGDLDGAEEFLDRAVELARRPRGPLPSWDVYHRRGVVRLRQGRLREALEDLRVALKLGRAWSWSAPRDEAAQIAAESSLHRVYAALIEAGNRLYLESGDAALARETFEAAEENRASSLRTMAGRQRAADQPPAFWEALAGLQAAEVEALRSEGGTATEARREEALEAAHARLVALEAALGPGRARLEGGLLEGVRQSLDGDSVWLAFHLGETDSWLWAVDREGLTLYRLAPRARIEARVQAAAEGIREDRAEAEEESAALYDALFGGLAGRYRRKTRWLVALDRELFEAPLAALREPAGAGRRYLVEGHITEVVPGAGYWLDGAWAGARPGRPSLFVGVGDPIYNTADRRFRDGENAGVSGGLMAAMLLLDPLAAARAERRPTVVLPRLVASARELEACARAWAGDRRLLEGAEATRSELVRELEQEPGVVHFATHFLELPGRQADSAIALGLNAEREIDLLTPEEIAHRPARAGLVVLSGCHSAAGAVLPGVGLLGLTRAFLAAGARAVISSRWATPDDDGALFAALYANLKLPGKVDAGRALRAAQLSMIRVGGQRAKPSYWSAYFLEGSYEF